MAIRRLSRRSALAAFAAPAVLSGGYARAAEMYTLRMSTGEPPIGAMFFAAAHFAQGVARRTNGQVKVEIYPNNQLVSPPGVADALVSGVLDLALVPATSIEALFPRYQVFDLPFLFKDLATGNRVLDGPIGAELLADLEPKGITGLAWTGQGFKQLETTTRSIRVPDDLKGMRIRIQAGPLFVAMYQAMGALPVVIDVAEAFVAIQNHTVEGIDLSLDGFVARNLYNLVKHVAMSNHICVVTPLLASRRRLEALPKNLQAVIRQEAKTVVPSWRASIDAATAEYIKTLRGNGVVFTEIQYPLFRKAMEPIYATAESKIGSSLLDRVLRASG